MFRRNKRGKCVKYQTEHILAIWWKKKRSLYMWKNFNRLCEMGGNVLSSSEWGKKKRLNFKIDSTSRIMYRCFFLLLFSSLLWFTTDVTLWYIKKSKSTPSHLSRKEYGYSISYYKFSSQYYTGIKWFQSPTVQTSAHVSCFLHVIWIFISHDNYIVRCVRCKQIRTEKKNIYETKFDIQNIDIP